MTPDVPPPSLPHVAPPIAESRLRHSARLAQFHLARYFYPLRAAMSPRRFHVLGIGIGKSGTHSLAGIFQPHYRAAHQPQSQITIDRIDAALAAPDTAAMHVWLRLRDQSLWLELESSPYLIEILPELVAAFPDAKFVLLMRDCYSWLNSTINYSLAVRSTERTVRHRALVYRQGKSTFTDADRILETLGLYSLADYLSMWARCNTLALAQLSAERRFLVRTNELRDSMPHLAQFLNIPLETLNNSRSHLYRTNADFGVLPSIDRDYMESRVQEYCQPLMRQFFPEIRHIQDAMPNFDRRETH